MTSNKIKGDLYELFTKNYIINSLNKKAYLWKEIPEKILIDAKLIHSHNENRIKRKNLIENPLIDVGVDILQIDDNKNYTMIQCKNGYNKGLKIEDLAGFYMMMFNHSHMNGNVYYTSKLSIHIKENAVNQKIQYIKLLMDNKQEEINNFKPYDYQIEASNKIIKYFEDNNNAILSLPCGCGKTYTSYLISLKFDKVIIISPLREFAKQNMIRFIEYGNINKYLLVDSDGIRDLHEIKEFVKNNNKFLISSTYKSVDIISKLNLENCLIIVDEFHNLSQSNVTDEDNNFYKLLNSDNKILLMSATPRIYENENEDYYIGEIVYNMTFNEAIDNKYICNYKIWLPSISEDLNELNNDIKNEININEIDNLGKINFLFKNLLYHGSQKCIIYCKDTNDLNNIKKNILLLNKYYLVDLNINEIIAETTNKERNIILKNFEISNKIELLLSIRILDECIDIPSCDSIYITYPSESKIRTIQRLCRCIRLNKNNKYKIGNIFIWCNEYDSILNTLSGIKEYDTLFKEKINVLENNFIGKNEDNKLVLQDKKLIEKYVLDIKEFKQFTWYEKLNQVKKYIDENNEKPNKSDKNIKNKQLSQWLSDQQKNYKNNKNSMKDKNKKKDYELFLETYKKYFMTNNEIWYKKLEQIKKYIDENNKKPNKYNINSKQLGCWISSQIQNYKNKTDIMKNEDIYNKWFEFINDNKYNKYLLNNEQLWYQHFNELINYININKNIPSYENKNKDILKLAKWLTEQKTNYKNKKKIMKNNEIYNKWSEFINDYNEYFISKENIWINKLEEIKKYININKNTPSHGNKNKDIKQLGAWLSEQKTNYKNKKKIMKNNEIYNKWSEFINDYNEYFISKENIWINKLEEIKKYININKNTPSHGNKNKDIKQLGAWLSQQKINYKNKTDIMKNEEIYNIWTIFINNEQYKDFLLTNEEKWINKLEEIKKYININKKLPSINNKNNDNDNDIKILGIWLSHQKKNYKLNKEIMKQKNIKQLWEEFIKQYKEFLLTNKEIFSNKLEQVTKYIDKNNKRPSSKDNNIEIKKLGIFLVQLNKNYKNNLYNMKDENIKKDYEIFLKEYKDYLNNE